MSFALWVAGLIIPAAILVVDLGRRRLTIMRILRPFIATAIVVPFVMPTLDFHGAGLALEAAGCVAGIALGLASATAMRVEHDRANDAEFTIAGALYAAIWIVVSAARLLFIYESSHSPSFGRALGEFLIVHHIIVASLADSIVFFGFAMLISNRGSLFVRARWARTRAAVAVPAQVADTARL